jgi:diguanylate cyclase (GGDEF)-like protein
MKKALIFLFLLSYSLFAIDNISVKLNWLNQFQFAGFYVAKEKGFYKDQNLNVTIIEQNNSDTIQDVLDRKIDFAIGRPSLIIDLAKGREISLLMAIYQHSPSVLIATNPDIKKVSDLVNKRIMATPEEMNAVSLKAMLAIEGIKNENITIQKHSFKLQDLIDGKTDAMACYISNEPYMLQKLGIKHTIFNPKNFGMDFYGDILYTSNSLIKDNPNLVKRFHEATYKGWIYAFEHIEESARLIFNKYNTQKKKLQHLMFEGYTLKNLAFDKECSFGQLDKQRFAEIINIYKIFNQIPQDFNSVNYIDPLGLTKEQIYIGILAPRGAEEAKDNWRETIKYLNQKVDNYHFNIITLDFSEVENAVKEKKVDFLLTNTMNYIQLANKYNISRIATIKHYTKEEKKDISQFGGLLFTKASNKNINTLKDIKNVKFGAVDRLSLGGWVAAKNEFYEKNIDEKNLHVEYFGTHDDVVYALLEGKIDAGTVRTGVLESMYEEKLIDLHDIKIINKKNNADFPFLLSTELYPEWPLSSLAHTNETLAFKVLSVLVEMTNDLYNNSENEVYGWGVPQDYSKVTQLLKKLKIYPFDNESITYKDVFEKYQLTIFILFIIFLFIVFILIYTKAINIHLKNFNKLLEEKVNERTQELYKINKKLKLLANTDELTSIDNRRHFFHKINEYTKLAKRNLTPLTYLSLDIDHFKRVNDTYGHQVGDEILKLFTTSVKNSLREIDLFGRVGGEEFAVCLQNTPIEGAKIIAEKIRKNVQKNFYMHKGEEIHITVSIGMAQYDFTCKLNQLMKKADDAMYAAKKNGRNRIEIGQ